MKRTLKLMMAILLLSNCYSIAQKLPDDTLVARLKRYEAHLPKPKSLSKTTATPLTLMAVVNYMRSSTGASIAFDSSTYTWSKGRHAEQNGTTVSVEKFDTRNVFCFGSLSAFEERSFDAMDQCLSSTLYHWDFALGGWQYYEQYLYRYTGSQMQWSERYTYEPKIGRLEPWSRWEYSYWAGTLAADQFSLWDPGSSRWEPFLRDSFTFVSGRPGLNMREEWNPAVSTWVLRGKSKTDYLFSGSSVVARYQHIWNAGSGTWNLTEVDSSEFAGGLETAHWDVDASRKWGGVYFNSYKAGLLDTVTCMSYRSGTFKPQSRSVHHYDGTNLVAEVFQLFDSSRSLWQTYSCDSFTYDLWGSLINFERWKWQDTAWVPWQYDCNIDVNVRYYYDQVNTSLAEETAAQDQPTLSPNPANTFTTLRYTLKIPQKVQICLRDLSGRLVYSLNRNDAAGQQECSIPLEQLATGTYILSLVEGTKPPKMMRVQHVSN
jgi:hypothetical protein